MYDNLMQSIILGGLVLALATATMIPRSSEDIGESANSSTVDCNCKYGADLLEVTDCGVNFPQAANISVDFSDDIWDGLCDGVIPPCDKVFDCTGSVTITAMANVFCGFQWPPGDPNAPTPLPPSVGTLVIVHDMPGCGKDREYWRSIVNNQGTSLCIVNFAAWCASCKTGL